MIGHGMDSDGMLDTVRRPGTVVRTVFCYLRTVLHGRYSVVGVVHARYQRPWPPD